MVLALVSAQTPQSQPYVAVHVGGMVWRGVELALVSTRTLCHNHTYICCSECWCGVLWVLVDMCQSQCWCCCLVLFYLVLTEHVGVNSDSW